jgi:hypothetical protein
MKWHRKGLAPRFCLPRAQNQLVPISEACEHTLAWRVVGPQPPLQSSPSPPFLLCFAASYSYHHVLLFAHKLYVHTHNIRHLAAVKMSIQWCKIRFLFWVASRTHSRGPGPAGRLHSVLPHLLISDLLLFVESAHCSYGLAVVHIHWLYPRVHATQNRPQRSEMLANDAAAQARRASSASASSSQAQPTIRYTTTNISGGSSSSRRALVLGGGAAAAGAASGALPLPAWAARRRAEEDAAAGGASTVVAPRKPLPPIPRVKLAPGLEVSQVSRQV